MTATPLNFHYSRAAVALALSACAPDKANDSQLWKTCVTRQVRETLSLARTRDKAGD
jgi:hypothetical protein